MTDLIDAVDAAPKAQPKALIQVEGCVGQFQKISDACEAYDSAILNFLEIIHAPDMAERRFAEWQYGKHPMRAMLEILNDATHYDALRAKEQADGAI